MFLHQGGYVRFDTDADGCDADDAIAPIRLGVQNNTGTNFIFADAATGTYGCQAGTHTITPQLQNNYFTVTPASAIIHLGGGDNSHTVDFCVTPSGIHHDAEVTIIPDGQAVVGNPASYKIRIRNNGNQTLSGMVNLNYPGTMVDYVTAMPSPHSRTETLVNWTYADLGPFESRTYQVKMQIRTPMDSPAVNLGDQLTFTANVTAASADETPGDNSFELRQTAVSSFDPNNKIVLEGSVVPPTMIGQYLNYVINFENTGNSQAQKVVIYDEIDTNQFEISSLQFTGLSHPGIPLVLGNKLEVYFQNVALDPGAQGFVAFKIKTKGTLAVGSTVSNKAKIYFDFNFPIDTNSAQTTFQLLGIAGQLLPEAKVYPNPAGSMVTVEANQDILSVAVTDAQGRKIAEIPADGNITAHDFSAYTSGIYYLKVTTAAGTLTRKLVKQ